MIDKADPYAAAGQLQDQRRKLLGFAVVEAGRGLVEQQQRRPRGERQREAEAAKIAERHRARDLGFASLEAHEVQNLSEGDMPCATGRRGAMFMSDQDVLAHRKGGEGHRLLERPDEALSRDLMGGQAGNILAHPAHVASRRLERSGHHIEEGCLARSVGADDAENLVAIDRKVDAVERDHAAERLAKTGNLPARS